MAGPHFRTLTNVGTGSYKYSSLNRRLNLDNIIFSRSVHNYGKLSL